MEGTMAEVRMFVGNFAPRNWALCDGQLLSIAQYQALFSLLGTTYGGDGRTSFALPDLRGRAAMHAGTGPGLSTRRIGQRFGQEYNILNLTQLPSHTHTAQSTLDANNLTVTIPASTTVGNKKKPTGNVLAVDANDPTYTDSTPDTTLGAPIPVSGAAGITTQVANAGASQPVNNIQPSEVVNYIICMQGVFPSRD
ncbi:phage tail protein [Acidiluteibacter ferrifornacis]|nr:tail fiber protein [Acidiluteibacter ferrifornacis]